MLPPSSSSRHPLDPHRRRRAVALKICVHRRVVALQIRAAAVESSPSLSRHRCCRPPPVRRRSSSSSIRLVGLSPPWPPRPPRPSSSHRPLVRLVITIVPCLCAEELVVVDSVGGSAAALAFSTAVASPTCSADLLIVNSLGLLDRRSVPVRVGLERRPGRLRVRSSSPRRGEWGEAGRGRCTGEVERGCDQVVVVGGFRL